MGSPIKENGLFAYVARLERKLGCWFDFSVKHPRYFLRDAKIPISRQLSVIGVEREPIAWLWRFISLRHRLEDGGAFVYFVEHGDLQHRRSGSPGVISLLPHIFAAKTRDSVLRRLAPEVVP